nr:heat shock protein 70 [Areca palm velarivirus 1]UOV22888.1 heat shock protein 70 [Areca palm velarivirus 1]UOV22943.1 heat shock protein 70 [Areca palm velarivirus 1]
MVLAGLDFGTTYSSIASVSREESLVLSLNGTPYIPTILAIVDNNKILVGEGAKTVKNYSNNYSLFYDLKRWVGVTALNFDVLKAKLSPKYQCTFKNGDCYIVGEGNGNFEASVKTLICEYIRTLIYLFQETFNVVVSAINVSVPADYTSLKRKYMKSILLQLGVPLNRIINEPSAAALYSIFSAPEVGTTIVYDFGGGTFDSSIIQKKGKIVSIVDTKGDLFLGGRDIDKSLATLIHSKTNTEFDFTILSLIKEEINNLNKFSFTFVDKDHKPVSFTITPQEYRAILQPFIDRSLKILKDLIEVNNLTTFSINMVGGSSLLNEIYNAVNRFGQSKGAKVYRDDNLRLAVALGCACLFSLESDPEFTYIDVNSQPLYDIGLYHTPEIVVRKPMPVPYTHIVSHDNSLIYKTGICVLEGDAPWFLEADPLVNTSISTDIVSKAGEGFEVHYIYAVDGTISIEVKSKDHKVVKQLQNQLEQSFEFKELKLERVQYGNVTEIVTMLDIIKHHPSGQDFANIDLDFPNLALKYVNDHGGISRLDEILRDIL